MRIHTVTGIIDTGELGETLFHEHIICTSPEFQRVFSDWLPRKKVVDIAVSKIKYAAEKFGIKTIFDATPLSLGRDIELLKEVSEKSEVQIVAATGFYCYDSFARHKLKVDFLADLLAEDAVNSHASLLKCAVGNDGLTPEAAKTLEVICAAHARTGLPVYIHTAAAAKSGWEAQKFVAGNNVAPEKTVIGHVSDSNDIEYPLELLKRGCYVSVDRIHPHNSEFILQLIKAGFADRVLVSHDHVCCYDTVMENPDDRQNAPHGLDIVHGVILPELRRSGVDEQTVKQLTTTNTARLFEE